MCDTLLYVEDSTLQRQLFKSLYKNQYDITEASTAEEALGILSKIEFDTIVMDLRLGGGMDGYSLAKLVRDMHPNIRITILTADIMFKPRDVRVIHKPYELRSTVY